MTFCDVEHTVLLGNLNEKGWSSDPRSAKLAKRWIPNGKVSGDPLHRTRVFPTHRRVSSWLYEPKPGSLLSPGRWLSHLRYSDGQEQRVQSEVEWVGGSA